MTKLILPLCALLLFAAQAAFAVAPPAGPDPKVVAALVEQLDDDDYFMRQQADTRLRAMGQAVLPLLAVERGRTDSVEAKHRIDRIAEAMQRAEAERAELF